jgi:hypothetical protein
LVTDGSASGVASASAKAKQRAQGRGEKANAIEEPADRNIHEAQQGRRPVHGGQEERKEIQRRAPRKIMPRYHFDLVESKTVADEGGAEVSDDIKAMDIAEEIARRLLLERPELKNRQYSILVSNEDGEEAVPLDIIMQ